MERYAELKLTNVFVLHSEWVLDGVVGQAACDRVSRGAPKLETADFKVEVSIADLKYAVGKEWHSIAFHGLNNS